MASTLLPPRIYIMCESISSLQGREDAKPVSYHSSIKTAKKLLAWLHNFCPVRKHSSDGFEQAVILYGQHRTEAGLSNSLRRTTGPQAAQNLRKVPPQLDETSNDMMVTVNTFKAGWLKITEPRKLTHRGKGMCWAATFGGNTGTHQ